MTAPGTATATARPAPPEGAPAHPARAWRGFALRIGAGVALLAVLLMVLPFDELRAAFSRVAPRLFAAAVLVYMSLHLIGVTKWWLVVNASGAGLPWVQAVRFYYAGLFGNTFLPSIIGGDVVRAGLALRHVRSKTGLVLGSVVDRLVDIVGLAAVAGLGVALIPSALDDRSRQIFLGLFVVFGVAGVAGVIASFVLLRRRMTVRMRHRLAKLRAAARAMARRPWVVLASLTLGMVLQISLVVLAAWLGRLAGLDASLRVWLFVWPLAKISALVPLTQGGLGVREAAQAVLFAPFGVAAVLAVAASLLFQGVIISGGLLGGLISFLLGRRDARMAGPPVAADAAGPARP